MLATGADRRAAPGITRLDVTDAEAVAARIARLPALRGLLCRASLSAATPKLDADPAVLRRIPAARYGQVEEVAEAVLFLLDPKRSAYVNGHARTVEGGFAGSGLLA